MFPPWNDTMPNKNQTHQTNKLRLTSNAQWVSSFKVFQSCFLQHCTVCTSVPASQGGSPTVDWLAFFFFLHTRCPLVFPFSCFVCTSTPQTQVAHAFRPTQEVFTEMEEKYGEVEEMNVCDNLGDHLVGNVYVKVGDCLWTGKGRPRLLLWDSPKSACVCVCVVPPRGGRRESSHGPKQPMVQCPAHPRRAVPRHWLQGSLLPPVWDGVRPLLHHPARLSAVWRHWCVVMEYLLLLLLLPGHCPPASQSHKRKQMIAAGRRVTRTL